MTIPPQGPFDGGFGTPAPQWGAPADPPIAPGPPPQWGNLSGPPPQWGAPAGPPQWGPPGGPPPQRHWWLLGGLAAVIILVIGAAVLFTGGKKSGSTGPSAGPGAGPTSQAGAPSNSATAGPKPAKSLSDILLTQAELSSEVGVPMSPSSLESGSTPLTNISVTPSNCTAVFVPGTAEAYRTSGFTEIAIAGFRGQANTVGTSSIEAVARFPNAAAAQAFFDSQQAVWQPCKHVFVDATYGDGTQTRNKIAYTTRMPNRAGDSLGTWSFLDMHFRESGCTRDLTVNADIIIDTRTCLDATSGLNIADNGVDISKAIRRKAG